MRVTIKAALISGIFIVIAAVISGIFYLLSTDNAAQISLEGNGIQIVGDNNSVINQVPERKIFIPILDSTDVHLGDNVFPKEFGFSYNPLTNDIYPQPEKGVIFFDKSNSIFLSDNSGPTQLGLHLVSFLKNKILSYDYSGYKHIVALFPGDEMYENLKSKYKDTDQFVSIGPTILIGDENLKGNYYNRYAAVGIAKPFNLESGFLNSGIDRTKNNFAIKIILKSYHGGIREGQSENFFIQVNKYSATVPSKSYAMRDLSEASFDIPIMEINLDGPNYIFVYVLPWVEEKPKFILNKKMISAVHFRDVGIVSLGIMIIEI